MGVSSSESRQPAVLVPGSVFARDFVVVSQLASGGMGTVYVVEQRGTGRRRALKLMHRELVHDEKSRERFEREATVGSRIDSEHVVDVVAAGVDETTGDPWIAMELLEGTDLAARVATRGPMSSDEVLEAFRQISHALDAAHRAGIVHRDLKPENVFLARARRSDARFTVKVLDFGIAKWLQEARAATMASQSIGTPFWMAPEQMEARGQIGAAADVWPLGLIAFYLLTGKLYWATAHEKEASFFAVLAEITTLPIERPSLRAAHLGVGHLVPAGFDEWFLRCVARDPAQRFASAGEVLRALEPVLRAGQAVAPTMALAGAPAPVVRAARDGRTVAVGAPPDAHRVLGAAPDVRAIAATQVSLAPMPQQRRGGRGILIALLSIVLAVAGIVGLAVVLKGRASRATSSGTPELPPPQLHAPPQLPTVPSTPPVVPPPVVPPPVVPPPVVPPPVVQPPVHYSGGSAPDVIGCIPCDGQARFMAPGQPGVALGLGIDNPAARAKSVPLARGGSLGQLTVTASGADGGAWSYNIWVNGSPTGIGCSMQAQQTSCVSDGAVTIRDGDRVTIGVGNPGAPFTATAGRGRFQVTYAFTLTPL